MQHNMELFNVISSQANYRTLSYSAKYFKQVIVRLNAQSKIPSTDLIYHDQTFLSPVSNFESWPNFHGCANCFSVFRKKEIRAKFVTGYFKNANTSLHCSQKWNLYKLEKMSTMKKKVYIATYLNQGISARVIYQVWVAHKSHYLT